MSIICRVALWLAFRKPRQDFNKKHIPIKAFKFEPNSRFDWILQGVGCVIGFPERASHFICRIVWCQCDWFFNIFFIFLLFIYFFYFLFVCFFKMFFVFGFWYSHIFWFVVIVALFLKILGQMHICETDMQYIVDHDWVQLYNYVMHSFFVMLFASPCLVNPYHSRKLDVFAVLVCNGDFTVFITWVFIHWLSLIDPPWLQSWSQQDIFVYELLLDKNASMRNNLYHYAR